MKRDNPPPLEEEIRRPGWGHPITMLAYCALAVVGVLLGWLLD